jgi:hypothetical protein
MTYEAIVPARLIGQHPDDGTMLDVVFRWTPGMEPGPRTMAEPMGGDDGSPDEFEVVAPANLTPAQEDAVVEWLDANWPRPVEDEPLWSPERPTAEAHDRFVNGGRRGRSVAGQVGNAFARGIGYSLARQLVNALVRALR